MNSIISRNRADSASRHETRPVVVPFAIAIALLILAFTTVEAQQIPLGCGSLENAFGPFDYTDPANRRRSQSGGESPLSLVERAHFTPDVANLIRGASSVDPLSDLEYTLRAFPNHPRALYAIGNYYLKYPSTKAGLYAIDCWFERAMTFRPNDAVVRVVYGVYLARKGDNEAALSRYKEALSMDANMSETHYNIGLLYLKFKQYDLALEHAKRAYNLGYPLPGLRNRLIREGKWKEIESE